ncbi:Ribonuclease/ribotoxin [Aspergillus homomorphus CBS 101889]|uniref:ribonuclease T1 n=1 Tax=Aspergillus homomorphus (strain CBS 101889) TaxID=1450537 RepID=A0A395I8B5_ASPHC|nr:Ribonuclease/ribotoxin [Aspergillus homomorphus CBS 101889]RAL16216.1 Ribonuclease/ribotoxin [Aspergillus homomorphus CBS 101889]
MLSQFKVLFTLSLFLAGPAFQALAYPYPGAHLDDGEMTNLFIRGGTSSLTVRVGTQPTSGLTCPATNNGENRDYAEHAYTAGQIKAAMTEGATLAAKGKQLGKSLYPHNYKNRERLPFTCGKHKMEFPIQTDGKVYDGGLTDNIPDRVIYDYSKDSKDFKVTFCGVIRHGPTEKFLKCT